MRVLTDDDVRAAMPSWGDLIDLAEEALTALAEGRAEAPPKPAVHTNPGMFANAMPASHPERNLLGCKWISVVPDNPARGLPSATGVMVVNDGTTGAPRCVMPATELTAMRTAAVTGACVRALAADDEPVTYLGTGSLALSHLAMLASLGRREVIVWGRRSSAVREVAQWAETGAPGVTVIPATSREAAVRDAGTLITGLTIGLQGTQLPVTLPRADALMLPLDYASCIGPDIAETALLAADDRRQFEAVRAEGVKLGAYPPATAWTGHLLGHPRPPGRIVVSNLGSGASDLLVADAIACNAERSDLGHVLDL